MTIAKNYRMAVIIFEENDDCNTRNMWHINK